MKQFFSLWSNLRGALSVIALSLMASACTQAFPDYPEVNEESPYLEGKFNFTAAALLKDSPRNYLTVTPAALQRIRGIYAIVGGKNIWGDEVVVYNSGKYLSVLAGTKSTFQAYERIGILKNNVITKAFGSDYGTLKTGDSSVVLEGFWQTEFDTQSGLIRLVIPLPFGSDTIFGRFSSAGNNIDSLNKPFSMSFSRPLRDTSNSFLIIGHAGGGRNVDRLPYPENSLNLIRFSERLGANGVEIDARLTKDGVPMLFHDMYITSRLVNGEYAVGKFSDYTYKQISTLARLKDGSVIPRLEDALKVIADSTSLRFVWLDIKTPDVIPKIIEMVKTYQNKSKAKARGLRIVLGLPDTETADVYAGQSAALKKEAAGLGEQIEDVERLGLPYWGPRWTLGTMTDKVKEMKLKGVTVLFWTLDEDSFIEVFLGDKTLLSKGGILTDHSSLVYYLYQR